MSLNQIFQILNYFHDNKTEMHYVDKLKICVHHLTVSLSSLMSSMCRLTMERLQAIVTPEEEQEETGYTPTKTPVGTKVNPAFYHGKLISCIYMYISCIHYEVLLLKIHYFA